MLRCDSAIWHTHQGQPRHLGAIRTVDPHLQCIKCAGGAQLCAAVPGGLLRWLRLPQGAQGLFGPGRHPNSTGMQHMTTPCPAAPWPHPARFGTVDHRVLRLLISPPFLQTGDPTGTGTGSETIYGSPFKDEFHSRLRFSHRWSHALCVLGVTVEVKCIWVYNTNAQGSTRCCRVLGIKRCCLQSHDRTQLRHLLPHSWHRPTAASCDVVTSRTEAFSRALPFPYLSYPTYQISVLCPFFPQGHRGMRQREPGALERQPVLHHPGPHGVAAEEEHHLRAGGRRHHLQRHGDEQPGGGRQRQVGMSGFSIRCPSYTCSRFILHVQCSTIACRLNRLDPVKAQLSVSACWTAVPAYVQVRQIDHYRCAGRRTRLSSRRRRCCGTPSTTSSHARRAPSGWRPLSSEVS